MLCNKRQVKKDNINKTLIIARKRDTCVGTLSLKSAKFFSLNRSRFSPFFYENLKDLGGHIRPDKQVPAVTGK